MINIEVLNKAISMAQQGQVQEAEALLLELLEKEPDNHLVLSSIGLFYISIKNLDKAEEYLEKNYNIKKTFGTVSAYGFIEFEKENYHLAAKILEESLNYGENYDVYDKLIKSLFAIEQHLKAENYTKIMLQKYPEDLRAIQFLIKTLIRTGKLLEAEKLCVKTLKKNLDSANLWQQLGFLKEILYCDDKEACECFKNALKYGSKDAYYNIAVSYTKMGDFEKAEEYFNKHLNYEPNNIDSTIALGLCKLQQKRFKEGYELLTKRRTKSIEKISKNIWKYGDDFEKEILVYCDQGFGDHIQFIRYLPFLQKKTEKITVMTHPSLIELFKSNYPQVDFIYEIEKDSNIQVIRINDLAYALDMDFSNIPFGSGYLKAENANIKNKKIKVGICWEAGAAGVRNMINRTININLLLPILNLDNIQVYSFQVIDSLKGNEKYADKMIILSKDFKNFKDTAEALKDMDIVISVDTAVAHLAGALGIRTFLMLPYAADWRWFEDTKTTPWYDSVEIFKQNDPISWEKPIEDIICKLKEYSL